MFFIIGSVIVLVSVTGGYIANGGHMAVLWQPFELVIILGAAIGGVGTAHRQPGLGGGRQGGGAPLPARKNNKGGPPGPPRRRSAALQPCTSQRRPPPRHARHEH